jgi:hypothetical protein
VKTCPFCAEDIQDAAIVCKHCGRDLAQTAPGVQPSPADQNRKSRERKWIVLGIVGAFVVIVLFSMASPSPPTKTLDVRVAVSGTALQVTNTASSDAVGNEMRVYINGNPPFTYRADTTVPAVGESVELPLMGFTQKDGERFNPFSHRVTIVWVGGGGYDYRSFEFR